MLIHATGMIQPDADIRALVPQEVEAVRRLHATGALLHTFVRADNTGAYFVLTVEDPADAARHLATLPLVRHQLMTIEYTEVLPPRT